MQRFYRLVIFPTAIFILVFAFSSCESAKNLNQYLYFQNGLDTVAHTFKETVIQPNDLISVQVVSKNINQEQTAIFNLLNNGTDKTIQGYQVGLDGNIDVPLIGNVKAAGLTKTQLQNSLTQKLENYVKDPTVLIRFLNYNINILGEVKLPGKRNFQTDRVTIIDAISAAGDLTDYGRRDNVMVVREENGKRRYYSIDLGNGAFFKSPAYQLLPNDVVYVSPTQNKIRNLDVNPDVQRRTGLIFTLVGTVTTLVTLYFTLNR